VPEATLDDPRRRANIAPQESDRWAEVKMSWVKWTIFGILALPAAEIAAFVVVAALIGFGWAVFCLLATSLAGVLVLRRAGRARLARLKAAMGDGRGLAFEGLSLLEIPDRPG